MLFQSISLFGLRNRLALLTLPKRWYPKRLPDVDAALWVSACSELAPELAEVFEPYLRTSYRYEWIPRRISPEQAVARVRLLQGFTPNVNIKKVLSTEPMVLLREDVLRQNMAALRELVADTHVGADRAISTIVSVQPKVLHMPIKTLYKQLDDLQSFVGGEPVMEMIVRAPHLLRTSIARMAQVRSILHEELGLSHHDLNMLFARAPGVLTCHPETNILCKIRVLKELLPDDADVGSLISRCPEMLSYAPANMREKLELWREEVERWDFNWVEAQHKLVKHYALLTYSKERVKRRLGYLRFIGKQFKSLSYLMAQVKHSEAQFTKMHPLYMTYDQDRDDSKGQT